VSHVITKRLSISRRKLLRGFLGLPPLAAMFNSNGTAYASPASRLGEEPIESRFLLWFNGNGIPERYWIPMETGADFELTPCLAPLEPLKNRVHVISGIDNPAARIPGPGNGHVNSMSGLVSCTGYTGRGAGGPSFDQVLAAKLGTKSRFSSIQVGVGQESHGENMHRNMSWAGYDRALPPEVIPHNLFDRLFGTKDEPWVNRKKSILDAVSEDVADLTPALGAADRQRLDEHLTSMRDLERAIAGLPPDYGKKVKEPEDVSDLTDYPRIAKIMSDLTAHAFASGQTRVVSYMLTKCQSLTRFPWLGLATLCHHDYTHTNARSPQAQRNLRDITRWHVEEFAYFLQKLQSVPEGEGTLLDHTCCLYVHEHAEADPHKNYGLAALLAGGGGKFKTGLHTKSHNTIGDLYLTIAEEVFKTPLEKGFPTAEEKMNDII